MELQSWLVSASASVVQTGSILLVFPSDSATEAVLYSLHSVTVAGQSEFGIFFFFFQEFSLLPSLAVQHSSFCRTHGGSVCQRSSG